MSLKRLRIEQLCPTIDSMVSPFCTLRHYAVVNFNVNENRVQYVHSKTDDPPAGNTVHSSRAFLSQAQKLERNL